MWITSAYLATRRNPGYVDSVRQCYRLFRQPSTATGIEGTFWQDGGNRGM